METNERIATFDALTAELKDATHLTHVAWKSYKWTRNALAREFPPDRVRPADLKTSYEHWLQQRKRLVVARAKMRRHLKDDPWSRAPSAGPQLGAEACAGTAEG